MFSPDRDHVCAIACSRQCVLWFGWNELHAAHHHSISFRGTPAQQWLSALFVPRKRTQLRFGYNYDTATVFNYQDVAGKIVAFANQSSRAVCVLSAMGSVSRVVLRHPADASPMPRAHEPPPYKNPAIYEVRR